MDLGNITVSHAIVSSSLPKQDHTIYSKLNVLRNKYMSECSCVNINIINRLPFFIFKRNEYKWNIRIFIFRITNHIEEVKGEKL